MLASSGKNSPHKQIVAGSPPERSNSFSGKASSPCAISRNGSGNSASGYSSLASSPNTRGNGFSLASMSCSTVASSPVANIPDAVTQRTILEQFFERRFVEGEFWYIIIAEWLEQLKRFLGMQTRKFYHQQRVQPGPIFTRRDYAHTVDVVHEDAWRMLVQWYGVAEGHKPMKLVVYNYSRAPDLEHNQNSFKVMLCNALIEDFQIMRFSKMEKVGHIEWKIRELYMIPSTQKTRLWAKADCDSEWQTLFFRDKSIGKCLEIDSDFTRPIIAMEISNGDNVWQNNPEGTETIDTQPSGPLYQHCIFEDVTSTWEIDIHDQIDNLGKDFMEKLHLNFSAFVQRAKDYVDIRENQLRDRERLVTERETSVEMRMDKVTEKEEELSKDEMALKKKMQDFESYQKCIEKTFAEKVENKEESLKQKIEEFEKNKKEFEEEQERFRDELKRMAEMNKIQDNRIKLDIGGIQFTTSLLTLRKDMTSMLAAMFSGRHLLKTENDGSYFIDRDGTHFRYILNYLRDGGLKEGTLPMTNETALKELLIEAEYYQLIDLIDCLQNILQKKEDRYTNEKETENVKDEEKEKETETIE
ncbi:BTB POZ domain-containing KCTD7 [Octopus vulgaris]|uniref:BTB POZ domain-containing KCTD7 n=3 Tax=Octopus TaxID=6643 RepID=A0AA36FB45_OCTVU|nr:uncharacterized protein LOC115232310 [Octopus sinensis]CAI9732546.1 BTB POZ domain-containing KCTD7 [Octopus vulgaris]